MLAHQFPPGRLEELALPTQSTILRPKKTLNLNDATNLLGFNVPSVQRVVGLLARQFGTSHSRPRSHSNYVHWRRRETRLWRLVVQSTWLAPCRDLIDWYQNLVGDVFLKSVKDFFQCLKSSNCFWEARREKISAFCIAFFFCRSDCCSWTCSRLQS